MFSPNDTSLEGVSDERREGVDDIFHPLSLDLNDEDIARIIGDRLTTAKNLWNKELNLDSTRVNDERYWLGTYSSDDGLLDFEKEYFYKNPRIFVDIETLIPMTLANPPQPIVIPGNDTDASREKANQIGDALLATYEDRYQKTQFMMVARHLLMGYRMGVMKYRWNDKLGDIGNDGLPMGDVETVVRRPNKIVIEETEWGEKPKLIGEYLSATVEELGAKFPSKQDKIIETLGLGGEKPKLSAKVNYIELWFTYYNSKGEQQEAVAWKFDNVVLGSMKNPNFNYDQPNLDDQGNIDPNNFFASPQKPYVFFSHINSGRYLIDDVSLVGQASTLQKIHDKRGRQIVENADQANSGTIFNTQMLKPSDAAKLIGHPSEKVGVDGDIRKAMSRLPQNQLQDYVVVDKMDARTQIDDIFGAHNAIKGAESSSPTLGQEVLSQRGDMSRSQTLANSIENGADQLYKGEVQMWKVFYDEGRTMKLPEDDGNVKFINNFSNKKIEKGVKIRVKTGSVLPDDPIAKANETIKSAAILDPLSIAEGLSKSNPKEFAKRIVYFRMMPDRYITDILGENMEAQQNDQDAMQEQQLMSQGQQVPPQENPSKDHLATHQGWIDSPEFQQLPPEIQQLALMHIKQEISIANNQLGNPQSQPPDSPPPLQPDDPNNLTGQLNL